jgi:hypothetical protein
MIFWFTLKNGSFTPKVSFRDAIDIFLIRAKYAVMRNVLLAVLLLGSLQVVAQSGNTNNDSPIFYLSDIKTNVPEKRGVYTSNIATVLSEPRITCSIPGYAVTSFTCAILPKTGTLIGPYLLMGKELNQLMKDALKAQTGKAGTIYIDDIKVKGPDGATRSINGIAVRYTN